MDPKLPGTHRALFLQSRRDPLDLVIRDLPVPKPVPGAAIVKVLATPVLSYANEIYTGRRPYPHPETFVPGSSAIGRIVAVGPDATLLKPGDLVLVDCVIKGRDDPSAQFLSGLHQGGSSGSAKLMHGEWRDSTYAEYYKAPLETCYPLDEKKLLGSPEDGGLGYQIEELAYMTALLVPFGGLRDVRLQPGESIIIAPATGSFGGAAVLLALALKAEVIAVARNKERLALLEGLGKKMDGNIRIVPNTGDINADTASMRGDHPPDVFFDISPPEGAKSTHMISAFHAIRSRGRVTLMGGQVGDTLLPLGPIPHKRLHVIGSWMYEREDILALIRLVEQDIVKLGVRAGLKPVDKFPLESFAEAMDSAAANKGFDRLTVLIP